MSFYVDENGNIGVHPEVIDTPEYKWVKYPKKRLLQKQLQQQRDREDQGLSYSGEDYGGSDQDIRDFYGF